MTELTKGTLWACFWLTVWALAFIGSASVLGLWLGFAVRAAKWVAG